jgi:hypothetical protein
MSVDRIDQGSPSMTKPSAIAGLRLALAVAD